MKTKCKHVKILNDRETHKVANELNEPGVGERNQTKCINRGGGGGVKLKATTPHERQLSKKRGRGEGAGLSVGAEGRGG